MRVIVLLKQVPDIVSERRLRPDGLLERTPAQAVLSEIDEAALEVALRAADSLGADVTAVTMGPASAEAVVRKALQVGAAQAVHLHDDALAGSDVRGTARALAAAVRLLSREDGAEGEGGLVVAGMASLDGLGSVVPTLLGAELGWPVLARAESVEVTPGEEASAARVVVVHETDHGVETIAADLPAVVSVSDTVANLRVPNFATMLAARKASVRVLTLADLGLDGAEAGLAGARAVVIAAAPRPERPAPAVVTADGARALVDFLDDRGLLEVGS